MNETQKNERVNALKEAKRFCKKFNFIAGMHIHKGSLAEGRNKL